VLRSYARVIESACDGIYRSRIAILVLEQVAFEAMDESRLSEGRSGRVVAKSKRAATGFNADKLYGIVDESGENSHGITAATHTCTYHIR